MKATSSEKITHSFSENEQVHEISLRTKYKRKDIDQILIPCQYDTRSGLSQIEKKQTRI